MTKKSISTFLLFLTISLFATAQQPKYTIKHFVSHDDTTEFVRIVPKTDGFVRTYVLTTPEIWDTDDNNSTYINFGRTALVCIDGVYKNNNREGLFTFYVMDSVNHKMRYKIWEQTFANNKLNGEWKTFSLKGNLVRFQTYKNDSLSGTAKDYWIDGKTIMEERTYFNGKNKFIQKEYFQNGNVESETTYNNELPTGLRKEYYPNGILKRENYLVNGIQNGLFRYYYPSGKIWIEQEMKNGLAWSVIANYTENGEKRNAGTLKEGNGTIVLYNEDGSIRETTIYKNGVALRQ